MDARAHRRRQMAALFDLAEIHGAVQRRLAADFTARGLDDVTPSQSAVLAVLFELKVATTSRLAQRLGLADVTVGRFVGALQRAGYVTRSANPADAREQLVRPTPKAYDRLPDFITLTNGVLDDLFEGCDPEQLAALGTFLDGARRRLTDGGPRHRLLPVATDTATWPGTGPAPLT